MILTVTINPLLEQRFTFTKVSPVIQNRSGKLQLVAGGKGINVNRQLNILNVHNIALTFAGGTYGKLFRESIKDEGIDLAIKAIHKGTEGKLNADATEIGIVDKDEKFHILTPEKTKEYVTKAVGGN